MPDQDPGAARPADERSPEARRADHAAIDRLADELLPSLVARLGASGLGELEVREGAWRVRLRRPAGAERRLPVGGRAAPGRGAARGQGEDGRGREAAAGGGAAPTTSGASGATAAGDGQEDPAPELPPLTAVVLSSDTLPDTGAAVATSPAVGVYRARAELRVGVRVRAGDRLGSVDVLGVAVEVGAPVDGIVGTALVEDGDAVEYGQPLIALEPLAGGAAGGGG